jgi:hypothetical protein
LKYVLEHSGSSRVSTLSRRVLGDIDFDINKLNYKFVKPTNEEMYNAKRDISRKVTTKKITAVNSKNNSITKNPNDIEEPLERQSSLKKKNSINKRRSVVINDDENSSPLKLESNYNINPPEEEEYDSETPKIKQKYVKNNFMDNN